MHYLKFTINGIPYSKRKTRGDVSAPEKWSDEIIKQTKSLPRISQACLLRVTFRLPRDKFPRDCPFGSDLDNLLKRLLDGLKQTVFCNAPGTDSCVISLEATKVLVDDSPGADVEILPMSVPDGGSCRE